MNMLKTFASKCWLSLKSEKGLGTLEVLLIVAVLIGIALLFRENIFGWVEGLLERTGEKIEDFDPASRSQGD